MPNVLVVDDEPSLAALLGELLRARGLGVRTAGTAEQATGLCLAQRPDCVVLDLALSPVPGCGLDGTALLAGLRAVVGPDVPVVVLTGSPAQAQAWAFRADRVLVAPFAVLELLRTVETVLGVHTTHLRRAG